MLKIVEVKLPKETFGQEINLKLLAQANHVFTDRSHVGLRSTKTRAEINRTTKKVYKQKGTGGARHGSRRANLFVGGGVVFGPRPLRRVLNLSQKIKSAAKIAAFSAKSKSKEISVVSGVAKIAKTKEVFEFVKKLEARRFTFLIKDTSSPVFKFFRNLAHVRAVAYKDATAFDILGGGFLLIDEEVFEVKKEAVKVKSEIKKTVKKGAKSSI